MMTRFALLAGAAFMLVAVAVPAPAKLLDILGKKKPDPHVVYAPSYAPAAPPPPADGAIFHASYGYAPLTSGARAARIGDVLTIVLVEKTQALKSNSAQLDHAGGISVTPPPTGPLSFIKNTSIDMSTKQNFNGKGAAAQSNSLSGAISVTIAEVLPNGNLLVKGEKQLTLNRGDEQIRISGIVRPQDIDFDNSVLSTRVADARITYAGTGEVARASMQGFLGRFFSRINPF